MSEPKVKPSFPLTYPGDRRFREKVIACTAYLAFNATNDDVDQEIVAYAKAQCALAVLELMKTYNSWRDNCGS